MASYNADIRIGVKNSSELTKLERKFEKINRVQNQIKASANTILGVEKQIIAQKRALLTLEGKAKTQGRERLKVLQLQKQELNLQKKELQQIVNLEKKAAAEASKTSKKRRGGTGKAALAGAGVAGIQIPGLGGVVSGGLAGAALTGGSLKGGLVGAAAAGVVELTGALAGFAVESTKVTAALNLQRRALANTVSTQDEYNQALQAIQRISDDFIVPIDEATAGFTKLNAAARASGFEVSEVEEVYRGLAAANTALGGNSERLAGILLATQQVFSKGKVQAEELRGQIGERLAGAFAEFAESADLSTKDLDKALERGEVGLEDFVNFAKQLLDKYEDNAKVIAQAPENAGARLKQSITRLKTALGPILTEIGENFQKLAKTIVDAFSSALEAFNRFINNARINQLKSFNQLDQATIDRLAGRDDLTTFQKVRLARAQANLARRKQELEALLNPVEATGKPPGTPPVTTEEDEDPKDKERKLKNSLSVLDRERRDKAVLELRKRQIDLQDRLNKANLAGDQIKVRELERERQLLPLLVQKQSLETARKQLIDDTDTLLAKGFKQEQITQTLKRLDNDLEQTNLEIQLKNREIVGDTIKLRNEEKKQLDENAAQIKNTFEETLLGLNNEIELLGAVNEEERERIRLRQALAAIAASDFDDQQKQRLQAATINLASLKKEQADYNKLLEAATPFANAFADGLTQGLRDVVAGTKRAEEAFADFLNNIANLLIQTAATLIAQYTAIAIARALAGFGASPGVGAGAAVGKAGSKVGSFVNSIIPIGLADGGYVTRPTPALIGEGGEPEYVIPASKMSESMARYSGGSRGNEVVPNNATGGGNSSTSGGGTPLFNLQTQVINNVEYATVEEVRAMGARATSAGAKQGEARVMSSLKNSRATRSRVGI